MVSREMMKNEFLIKSQELLVSRENYCIIIGYE
jgi:hypothetical protein